MREEIQLAGNPGQTQWIISAKEEPNIPLPVRVPGNEEDGACMTNQPRYCGKHKKNTPSVWVVCVYCGGLMHVHEDDVVAAQRRRVVIYACTVCLGANILAPTSASNRMSLGKWDDGTLALQMALELR